MSGGEKKRERDAGMRRVIDHFGSLEKTALALGVTRQGLKRRVPQKRLFQLENITGIAAEQLRPDLAGWIEARRDEQRAERMALARSRFSLVAAAAGRPPTPSRIPSADDEFAMDVLTAIAAARFVAADRGFAPAAVLAGLAREEQGARALAMALAHVVGRAKSATIGAMFGTTRQNVDNASERYLRARDGDDPDDWIARGPDGKPRVMERGRVRRAKSASAELWDLADRFALYLDPEPERKRA